MELTEANLYELFDLALRSTCGRARFIERAYELAIHNAEAQGEPVAWYDPSDFTRTADRQTKKEWAPLYACSSQSQGEQVLTDAARGMLADVVIHTIKTLERQLELIAERAPSNYLDKRPVVQSLTAHKVRLQKVLAEIERADRAEKKL